MKCIETYKNKMNANDYKTLMAEVKSNGYDHSDIVSKIERMSNKEMDIYIYDVGIGIQRFRW